MRYLEFRKAKKRRRRQRCGPLQTVNFVGNNWDAITKKLIELSALYGGAWTATQTKVFSNEVELVMFKNISSIPDRYADMNILTPKGHRPPVAFNGKIEDFTPAAIIREQNRGLTCG